MAQGPGQPQINLKQVGGTAVDTNSGTKSAGTQRVVLATDQPALTNKLLVTPDSVALPAHQSTNVDQWNGTTVDTNSGTKSAGTVRVVIATDQPALTNKLLVTPDSVALPAHQSTNVDQLNGTTIDTNSGNKSAGTMRVVIATDQPALSNALTVDTELPAAAALADGASNPTTPMDGACLLVWNGATWDRLRAANVQKDINGTAIGSITTVWTPTSGKKFRLMGGTISVSAAANVLFEDNSASNFIHRTPKLLADTPYNFDKGNGYLSSAANNVLKATSSAAANLTGTVYGTEE